RILQVRIVDCSYVSDIWIVLDNLLGIAEKLIVVNRVFDSKGCDIRRSEHRPSRDVRTGRNQIPEIFRLQIAKHEAVASADNGLALSIRIVGKSESGGKIDGVAVVWLGTVSKRTNVKSAVHA